MCVKSIFNFQDFFSHLWRQEIAMHFQLYSDQNQKPILGQKQLFLLIAIRAPEQSLISLHFPRISKVLCLIYTRTHCSLKQALIFKFVLPNDCEVQRFAIRYGNIVKMRLSLLNGSYRLVVRTLVVSIARNAWKHNAEIFVTICSRKNCFNHPEKHLLRAHSHSTSVCVPLWKSYMDKDTRTTHKQLRVFRFVESIACSVMQKHYSLPACHFQWKGSVFLWRKSALFLFKIHFFHQM